MSPRSSKPKKKTKAKAKKSTEQPPLDAYTGLLMAGFFAVVIGCILLVVELSKYDWTAAS